MNLRFAGTVSAGPDAVALTALLFAYGALIAVGIATATRMFDPRAVASAASAALGGGMRTVPHHLSPADPVAPQSWADAPAGQGWQQGHPGWQHPPSGPQGY